MSIERKSSDRRKLRAGMVFVLVNGVPVVRDGSLVEAVAPGRGLRR